MLDCQALARHPRRILLLAAAALLFPAFARAAEPGSSAVVLGGGVLRQVSGALSQLAARVSPAVGQILVTGYGPIPGEDRRAAPPRHPPRAGGGSRGVVGS